MSRLVHAGSAVVDHVYRIVALPAPGTERVAASYARLAGGGFNLMVAASRTGMEVVFAGQHGTGPNGDLLRGALAAAGIQTLMPPTASMDTGNCVVLVTDDAERSFVSWPGAEGRLTEADLTRVAIRQGDWVFASGYTLSYPGSRDVLVGWIDRLPTEIPFVFDPTPAVSDIPASILPRILARTNWLSCNAAEASLIAGATDVEANAALLMERHCPLAAGLVIRSGEAGAHVRLRDGRAETIPGFKVAAVDTNGAGDIHIGTFVSALARGWEPFEAARYANAAAAISVTRHGGSSAPSDVEIDDFLTATEQAGTTERNRATLPA